MASKRRRKPGSVRDRREKQRARDAKDAGALVGAFSTSDAADYVRKLIRNEGKRLGASGEGLTPSQRSMMLARMAGLVERLGRVTGETLQIDERRFLKSQAGQRLVDTIASVLEKSTDAALLLRLADALEALE